MVAMVLQPGLFDLNERYRKLSEVGDPLTRLKELINLEVFRPALALALKRSDGSEGGRRAGLSSPGGRNASEA
jgi:IS5 family transposase